MNNLSLYQSSTALAEAETAGESLGIIVATLGQFAAPIGLATGIYGWIREDDTLRNRGFWAAAIGIGLFAVGATLAGKSMETTSA
jgi:hypothetical protein